MICDVINWMLVSLFVMCVQGVHSGKKIVVNDILWEKWEQMVPRVMESYQYAQTIWAAVINPVNTLLDRIQDQIDEVRNSKEYVQAYRERMEQAAEIRKKWAKESANKKQKPDLDQLIIEKINIDSLLSLIGYKKKGDKTQSGIIFAPSVYLPDLVLNTTLATAQNISGALKLAPLK